MVDEKITHGGLSDRLRGLMTAYDYALRSGREFKINWTYPFNLADYLHPNPDGPDWEILPKKISFNKRNSAVKIITGVLNLDFRPDIIDKVLKTDKPQIHFYCNNTRVALEKYPTYFRQLFVPDKRITDAMEQCKASVGHRPYVSLTLRFQSLLGDFREGNYPVLQSEEEINGLIEKCVRAVEKVEAENPGKMVLVTSDSKRFLDYIKQRERVFVVPGDVIHMDYTTDASYATNMKSFVDFLMLMDADRLYGYATPPMFMSSCFFYTASLFGGKEAVFMRD